MSLRKRLGRLEAKTAGTEVSVEGLEYANALCAFLTETFEREPGESLAEIAARCCGLPHSRAFRDALKMGLGTDALIQAAQKYFVGIWEQDMVTTMRPMLAQCEARHGKAGLRRLVTFLPIKQVAERLGLTELKAILKENDHVPNQ